MSGLVGYGSSDEEDGNQRDEESEKVPNVRVFAPPTVRKRHSQASNRETKMITAEVDLHRMKRLRV